MRKVQPQVLKSFSSLSDQKFFCREYPTICLIWKEIVLILNYRQRYVTYRICCRKRLYSICFYCYWFSFIYAYKFLLSHGTEKLPFPQPSPDKTQLARENIFAIREQQTFNVYAAVNSISHQRVRQILFFNHLLF